MAADHDRPVLLQVRGGQLLTGAWLYVWLSVPEGEVLYVGATGLPPQVRTWLHLHDPDPDVGRLVARQPAVLSDPVDVLAFRVPAGLDRKAVKAGVIAALEESHLPAAGYVGERPQVVATEGETTAELVGSMVASIAAHRPVA